MDCRVRGGPCKSARQAGNTTGDAAQEPPLSPQGGAYTIMPYHSVQGSRWPSDTEPTASLDPRKGHRSAAGSGRTPSHPPPLACQQQSRAASCWPAEAPDTLQVRTQGMMMATPARHLVNSKAGYVLGPCIIIHSFIVIGRHHTPSSHPPAECRSCPSLCRSKQPLAHGMVPPAATAARHGTPHVASAAKPCAGCTLRAVAASLAWKCGTTLAVHLRMSQTRLQACCAAPMGWGGAAAG